MDVRDGDVREVGGSDPEPFQPRHHGLEGGARSGFDDRGLVGVEEVGGRGAFAAAVEGVDRRDPRATSNTIGSTSVYVACRRAVYGHAKG
jgi:hypothetical protein